MNSNEFIGIQYNWRAEAHCPCCNELFRKHKLGILITDYPLGALGYFR